MVHAAVAADANEAEEIRQILRTAGIASELEREADADAVAILVPESELDAAKEAIEAGTEPGDLVAEP
jgi:Zn-dependent peptidase ImmA (M78 family)